MKRILIATSLLLVSSCLSVYAAGPTGSATAPSGPAPASKVDAASAEKQLEAIERQYFQHTFVNEPVDHRLTRVEKFTFGETYQGSTISRLQRLAATLSTSPAQLEDVEDAPHKKVAQSRPATAPQSRPTQAAQTPGAQPASDTGESYPHITFLENEMLKQTFDGQPVEERLARLETKAFGAPSQNPDLSARTDNLERYAETRMHKKAFDMHEDDPTREDNPNFPVGYSTLPSNFGGGDPGFAPDQPSKFDLAREERKVEEDKAAAAPKPPNEHDRLLSRIAWCEQHTFGRTFPDMHMLQRLHQLNTHLFPQDKEKDVQLMDRMDLIVKTVVLQQHPAQSATQ